MDSGARLPISSDFATWELLLRTSSSNCQECLPFIREATDLIFRILESGQLPPPLEENTAQFLTVTIPMALKKLLNLKCVSGSDMFTIMTFVQLCLTVCVWAVSDPSNWKYVSLFDVPSEILTGGKSLYSTGHLKGVDDVAENVMRLFVESGEYRQIIRTVSSMATTPYVLKMAIMVTMLLGFSEYEDLVKASVPGIQEGMRLFLEEMMKDDNLSKQNHGELTELFTQYMSLMQDLVKSDADWFMLLEFINFCLHSEKLGNQLFGATTLQSFLVLMKKRGIKALNAWPGEAAFLQYLLEKDFKNEVLDQLTPVFSLCAEKKLFDATVLNVLWKKALTVHTSQRPAVFKLLGETMKNFDDDTVMSFVQGLCGTLTPEVVSFLSSVLGTVDASVGTKISDIIFDEAQTNPDAEKALVNAVDQQIGSLIRDHMIEKCVAVLEKSNDHKIPELLLPKLVQHIWMADIGSQKKYQPIFVKMIPHDPRLMFDVMGAMLCRVRKGVTPEEVKQLAQFADCGFWRLMDSLIHSMGADATTEEGFQIVIEAMDAFDFKKASVAFAHFLSSFLRLRNFQAGYMIPRSKTATPSANRPPELFYFNHYPLFGVKYLFTLLATCESEEVSQMAEDYILNAIGNYKTIDYEQIKAFIQEHFLPPILSEDTPDLVKGRYIKALLRILRFLEHNILFFTGNMIRHILGSDLVEIHMRLENDRFVLVTKKTAHLGQIEQQVAKICHAKSVYLYGGPNLDKLQIGYNRSLLELMNGHDAESITFRCKLSDQTSENLTFEETQSPSVYLRDTGFPEFLYGLLDNDTLKSIAGKCLAFLPDSVEMLKNIRKRFNETFANVQTQSPLKLGYFLKCALNLMRHDRSIVKKQISDESLNSLVTLLQGTPVGSSNEDLFGLLNRLMSSSMEKHLEILVQLCLKHLNQPPCKAKEAAADLLKTMLTLFPNTSALSDHADLTDQAICAADGKTWPTLKASVLSIKDKLPIFLAICSRIESLASKEKHTKYTVDLCIGFVRQLQGKIDMSELLHKCLALITVDDEKLTAYASDIATAILEGKNTVLETDLDLLKKILTRAFECTRSETRKSLFDLCNAMSENKEGASTVIQDVIRQRIHREFDFWSYDPSLYEHGQLPFCGLSNLGATCYMNSVLQQLFHTVQFRKVIFETKFEDQAKQELQLMFYRLDLSEKGSVDTRPFCNVWKGWDRLPINVREQQDAGEFLNLILDQLPRECQAPFKGALVNKMHGVNTNYESENVEPFFTIALDVKGLPSLEESFQSFIQEESFCGDDAIQTSEGKIDVKKFVRIRTLPPVIVFHLKRWEYDMRNGRYKVCDKFEFPHIVDVSPLLEDDQGEELYELQGIVLHSGNVDGGHYISLIKVDDEWYEFNDSQVRPFDVSELEHEAFGGKNVGFSAFMLFYSKMPVPEEPDISFDAELVKHVENENVQFASIQALFSEATALFVLEVNDLQIQIDYLMDILVHSSFGQHVDTLASRITEKMKDTSDRELAAKYFDDKSDKLLELYKCCSIESIIHNVNRILDAIVEFGTSNDHMISLTDKIISYFDKFATIWRQFEHAAHVPHSVITKWHEEITVELKKKWADTLTHFVLAFYEGSVTKAIKELVEFRTIFGILKLINKFTEPVDWLELWNNVLQNPANAIDYFILLLYANPETSISRIMSWLSAAKTRIKIRELMRCVVEILCNTDQDVSEILCLGRNLDREREFEIGRGFLYALRSHNVTLRDKLVERCRRLLFATLFSESEVNAGCGQLVFLEMFPNVPWFDSPPSEHTLSKSGVPPTLRKPDLTWDAWYESDNAKDISDMKKILQQLLDMEPEFRAFMEFCYQEIIPTRLRGVKALELIRWMIKATKSFDKQKLDLLLSLFRLCADMSQNGNDATIGLLVEAVTTFPAEMINIYLEELYIGVFRKGVKASLLKYLFAQEEQLPKEIFERLMKMSVVFDHLLALLFGECPGLSSWHVDHVLQLLSLCSIDYRRLSRAFDKRDHLSISIFSGIACVMAEHLTPVQLATAISYVYLHLCDKSIDRKPLMNLIALVSQGYTEPVASEWGSRHLTDINFEKVQECAVYYFNDAFRDATLEFVNLTAKDSNTVSEELLKLSSPSKSHYYSSQARSIISMILHIGSNTSMSERCVQLLTEWRQKYPTELIAELGLLTSATSPQWLLPIIVQLVTTKDVFCDSALESILTQYLSHAPDDLVTDLVDHISRVPDSKPLVVNSLTLICTVKPSIHPHITELGFQIEMKE